MDPDSQHPPVPTADAPKPHPSAPWSLVFLVTWFGSGLLPRAPGTMGSLAALPFGAALHWWGGAWALVIGAVAVFLVGWWASEAYVRRVRKKDPGEVVIDEVAAQWLVLAVVPLSLGWYLAAFIAFRVFDILKPWPVRWADRRIGGGLGIMIDDILAAGYAILLMWLLVTVVQVV